MLRHSFSCVLLEYEKDNIYCTFIGESVSAYRVICFHMRLLRLDVPSQ